MLDSSQLRTWNPKNLSVDLIEDGEIYHSSLYEDSTYLNPRSWHKQATEPLIHLVKNSIKDGDIVLDYGSGTGGSAVELVKYLDKNSIDCHLILIDPLESWFSKAYSLLKDRPNTYFCKSFIKDSLGVSRFLTMEEMIGNNKIDIILSSSTFHLIPEFVFGNLLEQFHSSLKQKGQIFWSSGDIPNKEIFDSRAGLLHEPYRVLAEYLKDDKEYKKHLNKLENSEIDFLLSKSSKIFPVSKDIDFFKRSFSNLFKGSIINSEVSKSLDEACLFMKNHRLSEVAGAVSDRPTRELIINSNLEKVYAYFDSIGFVKDNNYNSFWYYGSYYKV